MNQKRLTSAIAALLLWVGLPLSLAQPPIPKQKRTIPGLYVTAKEAYEMWLIDKNKIKADLLLRRF
jgi:hypothetical protein